MLRTAQAGCAYIRLAYLTGPSNHRTSGGLQQAFALVLLLARSGQEAMTWIARLLATRCDVDAMCLSETLA